MSTPGHAHAGVLPADLDYRLQGPGDWFLQVRVAPDGRFRLEQGSFRSAPPRIGRLDPAQRVQLAALLEQLAPLSSWSYGPLGGGFEAELVLGDGPGRRYFRWSGRPAGRPLALVGIANLLHAL